LWLERSKDKELGLRLWWTIAASGLAASVALPVHAAPTAADATEPIRIEYRAETGCPSADEFNRQVFRRTSSARLATSGDMARTFIVSIERRGSGLAGSLFIRQSDGTTESREVVGPACKEVATVLALATALAIDPQASLAPEPEPGPEPALSVQPAPSHPAPDAGRPPASGNETEAARAAWIVALGPALEAAIAPRVAFGAGLEVAWRPEGGGPISALGLEATYLRTPEHQGAGASSSFQFVYAKPSLCSVALRWQAASGVAPCLGVELGAVTGSGSDIPHTSTNTRVWASVDIGLRLFQTLGERWFLEAEGSVVLPITRYEFVFLNPDTPVYSVPAAAGAASLRVGLRL
jgi:hypothetical protein